MEILALSVKHNQELEHELMRLLFDRALDAQPRKAPCAIMNPRYLETNLHHYLAILPVATASNWLRAVCKEKLIVNNLRDF